MKWLSLVGIGEDGLSGLGADARSAIAEAEVVFGGARHLELAAPAIRGAIHRWDSPFSVSIETILALKGHQICVLASGDPFHFGVGSTLARYIDASQMLVYPHFSAFSLAAARLGWALQDVHCLSLHGRPLGLIRPYLHSGARILALTSDETSPAALAHLLTDSGFGTSIITVLEALGGADEKITGQVAMHFSLIRVHRLNICAISVSALPQAQIIPFAQGLDDGLFEHDGQITKHEIRALTLSALAPCHGEILWDIGSGSGSVSIEWMLADASLSAIAIEANAERAARIARNATNLGTPGLKIVEGVAPTAFVGLELPHAIFIGGGGSGVGVLDAAIAALRPGGRLVANAVTLELEALLLAQQAIRGGTLTRLEIVRTTSIGDMTGWCPAKPITQWLWKKP